MSLSFLLCKNVSNLVFRIILLIFNNLTDIIGVKFTAIIAHFKTLWNPKRKSMIGVGILILLLAH